MDDYDKRHVSRETLVGIGWLQKNVILGLDRLFGNFEINEIFEIDLKGYFTLKNVYPLTKKEIKIF